MVGVKVTFSDGVPGAGAVPGAFQAKTPPTDAVPPESVDDAKVCGYVMGLAVGHTDTIVVALFTVTFIEPVTVL